MTQREQRWLTWKNYDTGDDPTCPAFGCIELFDYEFIGGELILKGRSYTGFQRSYGNEQGAQWYHVFNNSVSVPFGGLGKCTFDLPTWAALEPGSIPQFTQFVTFGVYLNEDLTIDTVGSPWRLAVYGFPGSAAPGQGGGYNVYCGHPGVENIAYVGGMPTFMRAANSA